MIGNKKIERLQTEFGFDELTAWRHLRDRERARNLFRDRARQRVFSKW